MPDLTQILKSRARQTGMRLDIIEKDYALSYLLIAILETPGLGDRIVLKGGTALRKLYYPDYRFSEDLDYSTRVMGNLSGADEKMTQAARLMEDTLQERGPFGVQVEPLLLREAHPGGQAAYNVRVQFPSQRQALCRLKVEITVDEPVLLPPETCALRHDFNEPLKADIPVYPLAEIVAEKLRALLQSRARLTERGWGASRVCRDYYDLWQVLRREKNPSKKIPGLTRDKCKARGMAFDSPQEFLAQELLAIARAEWNQQLSPFIRNAPPVEQVIIEVRSLILDLWR